MNVEEKGKYDMKFKLTSLEKKWILYDVGNSAFILLAATIMPIYFNSLAEASGISDVNYLSYWGYATSIATVIVAFLGPIFGTASDFKGWRKRLFLACAFTGALGCMLLGFLHSWLWFLVLFTIAKTAYSVSLVIYDSMLNDVSEENRVDVVSANGYAWGYIGSVIPFVLCLILVLFYEQIGISISMAMALAFSLIAIWWILFSLPLAKAYRQRHYVQKDKLLLMSSFKRLASIFSELKQNKKVLYFLLAFFFYIDGVYTIIDMATAYGKALGFATNSLLLALLVTQIVAFPAALFFGRISSKYRAGTLIKLCTFAYLCVAIYAIFLTQQYQFWILAVAVGGFQGAIQSMSRSYFAKIIPREKSGEYFGIYDICGKGASFLGTMLVAIVSQISGKVNYGVGTLTVMFLIGLYFFNKTEKL